MYRQSEKKLVKQQYLLHVHFGRLAAEIVSLVSGNPSSFNGFRVLAALLHGTVVVGVSQTAAMNRGRHLYSAGRPSRWALAHISSCSNRCYVRRCRRQLHAQTEATKASAENSYETADNAFNTKSEYCEIQHNSDAAAGHKSTAVKNEDAYQQLDELADKNEHEYETVGID